MTDPHFPQAGQPRSHIDKLEEEASVAGAVAGEALTALEIGVVVLIGLLVTPPLGAIVFVVVAPLLAVALVLGLLVAVVSAPYLLFHHFRGHHGGHLALLGQRLGHAGRAIVDLAPHRIVAAARKSHPAR